MSTLNTTFEASNGTAGSDNLSRLTAFFGSLLASLPRAEVGKEAADDAGIIYGAFGL
jgi:hypothetical protein